MKIIGYDTGKLSGVGMWVSDDAHGLGTIWTTALDRDATEDHMRENVHKADVVVIERLTINAQSHKKSPELLISIELAGVGVHYARLAGVPVVRQSPSDVMKLATDEKLKRIGWYVAGPDHQRDVRRHILVYALEKRYIDPRTVLPKEER